MTGRLKCHPANQSYTRPHQRTIVWWPWQLAPFRLRANQVGPYSCKADSYEKGALLASNSKNRNRKIICTSSTEPHWLFRLFFSPLLAFLLSSYSTIIYTLINDLISYIKMTCQWPGNLTVADAVPCGPTNSSSPVVPCCGERDQCMTDNLCRYTRSRVGGSGYYIAGCSASDNGAFHDASYSDICVNRCCTSTIF